MPVSPQNFGDFGGQWSDLKLSAVEAYFEAFNRALSKTDFKRVYIDAFAGGGRIVPKAGKPKEVMPSIGGDLFSPQPTLGGDDPMLDIIEEPDSEALRHGSPLLALKTDPGFHEFIFIERDPKTLQQLQQQVEETQMLNGRPVQYICEDANTALVRICSTGWSQNRRATIFLDPFALHIRWSTLEAIARTKGMDMWMLFPAMAVNRMLPRKGEVPDSWAQRLNDTFGDLSWKQEFYAVPEPPPEDELFPEQFSSGKEAKLNDPFGRLSRYVTRRLKTVFADAVEEPLVLKTSTGSPLFLLCFAVANKKGAPIAKRIADHIITNQKQGH